MSERPGARRAFVVGFDGVPWNLIERWTDAGELEHFGRLRREGVAGPLESTKPANTPAAWPSIVTGVWPDKHGIYEFTKLDPSYSQRHYTVNDRQRPALWEMCSPAVVGNVPMTYPASEIDGKLVAGMMAPDIDTRCTHPDSLAAEIRNRIPDYQIALDWQEYRDDRSQLEDDLSELVSGRRELLRLLMETDEWRLFFFVFTAPDRLQHLVWDEDVILEHYQLLDEILGEIMDYCERYTCDLFVVSDHGFGPVSKAVNVNTVLEESGLLTRTTPSGVSGALSTAGLTKDWILDVLERVNIDDTKLTTLLPRRVVDAIATQVPGDHNLYDVDHDRTSAFLHGLGSLYVNDSDRFVSGAVPPSSVQGVKSEVAAVLEAVVDPETGEQVLDVHDGERLHSNDELAPNLLITPRANYKVNTSLASERFSDADALEGDHRPNGIFLAWGDQIATGRTVADATVVDVAPTVLHALGSPVPGATDGHVVTDAFASGTRPATTSPRTKQYAETGSDVARGDDHEDAAVVKDRLRGLGYLE